MKYRYTNNIIRMVLLLIFTIVSLIVGIYCDSYSNSAGSIIISTGTILGTLFASISSTYLIQSVMDLTDNTNWKSSQSKLNRAGFLQSDTMIRISFAYLYRIRVDGQYFLVKNKRTKKYQPVGGAYKFDEAEANYLRDTMSVESDDRIPVDKITQMDYRLLVKNKDLRKFVKRFNSTEYRENIRDLKREFVEEIFCAGILDQSTFGTLTYKYCGRHMTDVVYSNVFKHYELLLADIVELQLSDVQADLFRNLMHSNSDKYCFVSADDIKALGVKYNSNNMADTIGNHTFKILSENADDLIMKDKYKELISIRL